MSQESVRIQVIDWVSRDVGPEYTNSDFRGDLNLETPLYVIKMFGKTLKGETICINALNYPPHFYIKLPSELDKNGLKIFREFIESKIPKRLNANKKKETYYNTSNSLHDVKQLKMKDLWGFTNNEKFSFIQLSFYNEMTMKFISYIFKKSVRIPNIFSSKSVKLNLYESNIEPYLRFIHKQNIQPSGWIEVLKNNLSLNRDFLPAKKGIQDYSTDWGNIKGIESTDMAPFLIASFDIECNSSHGDFPLPKKNYEKVAMELNTLYQKNKTKLEHEIIEILKQAILSGFNNELDTIYKISKIFTKRIPKIDDIEQLLLNGLLDEIYIILKGKLLFSGNIKDLMRRDSIVDEIDEIDTSLELDEIQKFKNIFKHKEINNTPTIIISQLTEKLNKFFPDIEGDQVIQIGTTFHKYGEKNCCYKHIITLNTCDLIQDVKVVSVETEIQLIKEWVKLINKYDPDIITGYNIFGFDFDFLYKRANELNIVKPFLKINRIKNCVSEWKIQNLSSAALGDNELKYIKMEGRVLIDMMKIIQRDHKLDSYKLDSVSGVFISGKIQKIDIQRQNESTICCTLDNTNGIQVDSFITLDENEKMKVIKIEDKKIYLEYNPHLASVTRADFVSNLNSKKWGLSKDDVSPKEIFECQKGSSTDRARVAKYCVMDCALCNFLMIKMETIANNIGMSNVCSVPLSYIFMRGQGVKIFSFVAKQCKEDGILIPVLDKDWKCECGYKNSSFTEFCKECNSLKIDDEGYEGAIVLTPSPGIYTEDPVIVLDYASLYPSSMISENISHDSIILDTKYDNLPDYEYINITYDIFEGKGDKKKKVGESTCRFAQFPDKKKGVLPRILQKLLEQRKNTRKRMKEVKIILNNEDIIEGLIISKTEKTITIKTKEQIELIIDKSMIVSQEDLYNDFEKAVLEGLQLAYKVTANSLYGQVGAKTSPIFLKELAASTTATGRNLIMSAKKYAEDNFNVSIVYGDSILSDEPIILRNSKNGLIDVKIVSEISKNWESYEDFKNSDFVVELRFILNKILIDGTDTEDECIKLIKSIPKWLRKKTIENKDLLLTELPLASSLRSHNNLDNVSETNDAKHPRRWKWYNDENPLNTIVSINELFEKDTTNRFDKQQSLVDYEIWTDNGWQKILRLIRHKTNKKIHRVTTGLGAIDVTEDHSLCDINKLPIKPNEIEIDKTELLHSNIMDINFDLLETNIPMVIKYPDEYWGETNEKHKDITCDLYECITCHNEYDGIMYYWSKVKRKTEDKEKMVRGNQCKLCIKAKQCSRKGKEFNGKLNREIMNINKPSYVLSKDEAWVWGFFLGDGSCGQYECKSGNKNSWALNNKDIERLDHAKEILERIEGFEFKRLETLDSSGVYKLVPHGSIIYMVQKYRKLMYNDLKHKKVPKLILNAPYIIRKAFFDGYYEADGTKAASGNNGKEYYLRDDEWNNTYSKVEFTSKNKSTAQQLYLLATSIGFKLKVLTRDDKLEIYRMGTYKRNDRKKITNNFILEEINITDEYVYDIETVSGRFTAGVGNIVVNNTDSIFIVKDGISKKYNNDKRQILLESIKLGNAISEGYQKILKEPHSLCYEKCLYPFIIFAKKRYVGNLYENDPDKYYRKVMGLSLKRRDFANISKIVFSGVIDIILKTNDINESIKFFHKCIQDILDGKYPLEDFVITKTLKGQYKTPDKIVHKVLADRMAMRDKGSAPQTNDRVPFIYIVKKEKRGQKLLQGDKVEDPKYIIENKLQIDYEFYITNQIMNSITQLYSLVIEKLPTYKLSQDYFIRMERKLKLDNHLSFDSFPEKERNELIKKQFENNQKIEAKISVLKEKEVKKLLFEPYLNKLYSKKNNMREITDFLILNKN
jgi:DNA polymerase elongation subunit (family B)